MKHLALAFLLLFTPACFLQRTYVERPVAFERVTGFEPGRTTAAEVVEVLGAPNEVVQLGRRSAYRYEHRQTKTAGLLLVVFAFNNNDTQADRAWVFFDENDVLSHVGTTVYADTAEYAMPWVSHDE